MMTPDEINQIHTSFELLKGKTELFAALFYERLFMINPSLRMMFRGDMTEQGKKLMSTMLVLNASLEHFAILRPTLQLMGAQHAQYGVRPGHYRTVATAVLQTLEQFAGPRFDEPLCQAWTKLLGLVADEMLCGAAQADTVDIFTAAHS